MTAGTQLQVPPELIETVAQRAAEILKDQLSHDEWMDVGEAADYLRCPRSRIYALTSAGRIPHHRDGARLLFRKSELDAWVEHGGARRT